MLAALSPNKTADGRKPPRFAIIAETHDYAVVDKPPFLLVHPTKPHGPPTLWSELRQLLAFELATGGQVSIINRLDRETSGLVLVAKTAPAARRFGLLMQQNRIDKEYLAIVWGWPKWDTVLIDKPLGRLGNHQPSSIWLKQGVMIGGAPAQTLLFVEQRFQRIGGQFSVVRAVPRTGRTHQIRVHLADAGFPVVGDKIYGPNEKLYLEFIETGWTSRLQAELLLPRQALHSSRLSIEGEGSWTSELPPDLMEFVNCSGGPPVAP
jgi:23S rRNA pseudouridine1911/1915/1917 synthase